MTTHEVLVAARNLIARYGHTKYDLGGFDHGFCAVGSIHQADTGDPAAALSDEGLAAWALITRSVGADLLEWNNALERTQQEVLDLFDRAIAATAPPDAEEAIR